MSIKRSCSFFASAIVVSVGIWLPQCSRAEVMVVGIDRKFAYDEKASRQAHEPGHDEVVFFEMTDPAKPKLIGSVALENSILGPPTNVAVTPDQSMALVANAMHSEKTEAGWKAVPADDLFVVDLKTTPPRLKQTVKVGRQPSGLSISKDGSLALVANRDSKTISVLAIRDGVVSLTDTVALSDSVGSVAIAPDGRRAVATKTLAHKATLLNIGPDGKVSVDRDLWVGLFPWNVAISPDGAAALVNNIGNAGQSDGSAKTVSVIDLAAPTPYVTQHVSVGDAPEGVVFDPQGKLAAITILQGSYDAPQSAWYRNVSGKTALLAIDRNRVEVVDSKDVGSFPEGLAFSANGKWLYVGNYHSNTISVFKVEETKLIDAGPPIGLPGPPASLRIGSQ